MWINDLKKKVESIKANKSKPLAFSDKLFVLCAEEDKSEEKHIKINTVSLINNLQQAVKDIHMLYVIIFICFYSIYLLICQPYQDNLF